MRNQPTTYAIAGEEEGASQQTLAAAKRDIERAYKRLAAKYGWDRETNEFRRGRPPKALAEARKAAAEAIAAGQ